MGDVTDDPAVGVFFGLTVDGLGGKHDLGTFISCDGLSLEIQTEDREEGGNNDFVWKLPVRVKYSNVKLNSKVADSAFKLRTTSKTKVVSPQG